MNDTSSDSGICKKYHILTCYDHLYLNCNCISSHKSKLGFRSSAINACCFFYLSPYISSSSFYVWRRVPSGHSTRTCYASRCRSVDEGLARGVLRDHAGQNAGYDGWRSTSTNSGSLCSPEYGPWCAAVPLMVERHHRLNTSPVLQSKLKVAPGPGALQVMCQRQIETDSLAKDNYETPVPLRPPQIDNHHHSNGWELTALSLHVALALRMTTGTALTHIATQLLLALKPAVIAVHLLPSFNGTGPEIVPLSLIGALRPTWLGDLLGTCLCHPDTVLHHALHSNHPRAIVLPLGPGGCPPIASVSTPLGHLHLDLAGGESPVLTVHAPGLLSMIINNTCIQQTNAFSGSVMSLLSLTGMRIWI